MALNANLYFDEMDLQKYCPGEACELCKVDSFDEFLDRLKSGQIKGGVCPHWSSSRIEAFRIAVEANGFVEPVPMLDVPRPTEPQVLGLNDPGPDAPVLVTGNSELTQSIVLSVLSLATGPMKLLTVDVRGHTVDMALVFKEFTADRVRSAFEEFGVDISAASRIILPGLAAPIVPELTSLLGKAPEVGPICAAEIPLHMADDWLGRDESLPA